MRRCVWSRNLVKKEALAQWGLSRQKQTNKADQCRWMCAFFFTNSTQWARASSFMSFLDHTQRSTAVGRTLLDEWSARRRDLYLTTHNTHNRQTSMPPVGFELTISAGERPQTYASDRAATGTGECAPWCSVIVTKHKSDSKFLVKCPVSLRLLVNFIQTSV